MIDTVSKAVQLTDVIDPLPVKPDGVLLVHNGNNTVTLRGDLWVHITALRNLMELLSSGLYHVALEHARECQQKRQSPVGGSGRPTVRWMLRSTWAYRQSGRTFHSWKYLFRLVFIQ